MEILWYGPSKGGEMLEIFHKHPPHNKYCSPSSLTRLPRFHFKVLSHRLTHGLLATASTALILPNVMGIARSGSVMHSLQCNRSGSVGERLTRVQLEPNALHVYERNVHRSAPDHPR